MTVELAIGPTMIRLFEDDLDAETFVQLSRCPLQAWDVETTGLSWDKDRLLLVQVEAEGQPIAIVRLNSPVAPPRLSALLRDNRVQKLFHHAMFDLRFLSSAWNVSPRNVACTKIAAKLLEVPHPQQSLAPLLERFIGVRLDKTEQTSNWGAKSLSDSQVRYAARDVLHLRELLFQLRSELIDRGRWDLALACFDHLPTRVELELHAIPDPYTY